MLYKNGRFLFYLFQITFISNCFKPMKSHPNIGVLPPNTPRTFPRSHSCFCAQFENTLLAYGHSFNRQRQNSLFRLLYECLLNFVLKHYIFIWEWKLIFFQNYPGRLLELVLHREGALDCLLSYYHSHKKRKDFPFLMTMVLQNTDWEHWCQMNPWKLHLHLTLKIRKQKIKFF